MDKQEKRITCKKTEVHIIAVQAAKEGTNFKNYVESLVSKEAERIKNNKNK